MTNFDFLKNDDSFLSFADVAISAENLLHIDCDSCAINCRRAMEFAVKWMYSIDEELEMPCQDNLVTLMDDNKFKDIVGIDVWHRMTYIRKIGNSAAHDGKKVTEEQAELCIENLYIFLDFVACCYSKVYKPKKFDRSLLELTPDEALSFVTSSEINLTSLIEENEKLKSELTARRTENQHTYIPQPLEAIEYSTRKLYIESMLEEAGWTEGKDCLSEVKISGGASKSNAVYADYVLYGDGGKPLAVIEAKQTCKDVSKGRQQAKQCADLIEEREHHRPVIFLTNGFEMRVIDNCYPERNCSSFYSKSELEKLFDFQNTK